MRRLDFEDILGQAPAPNVEDGQYLIDVLFGVGPTRGDMPLCEGDLEPWERRRGIDLMPWQAELLVELSGAYLRESHLARDWTALAPWPPARNVWRYVQDEKHKREQEKENLKEKPRDGSSKRHRNPPTG